MPFEYLREIAQAELQKLAHATGDMVFLVGRSGYDSICLSRIAGDFPIQTMTRTEGDRHPLGIGAGGLAILAAMHDADVRIVLEAIAPRLPAYHLERNDVLDAVNRTRDRGGMAIDEGSAALDVTALGRAIFDRSGSPVASVFVASIGHRMKDARQKKVGKLLLSCTDSIQAIFQRRTTT